eukprot:156306-Pelagomonas_calceolata.AAC.1
MRASSPIAKRTRSERECQGWPLGCTAQCEIRSDCNPSINQEIWSVMLMSCACLTVSIKRA